MSGTLLEDQAEMNTLCVMGPHGYVYRGLPGEVCAGTRYRMSQPCFMGREGAQHQQQQHLLLAGDPPPPLRSPGPTSSFTNADRQRYRAPAAGCVIARGAEALWCDGGSSPWAACSPALLVEPSLWVMTGRCRHAPVMEVSTRHWSGHALVDHFDLCFRCTGTFSSFSQENSASS